MLHVVRLGDSNSLSLLSSALEEAVKGDTATQDKQGPQPVDSVHSTAIVVDVAVVVVVVVGGNVAVANVARGFGVGVAGGVRVGVGLGRGIGGF